MKQMIRGGLAILLSLGIVFTLASCGKGDGAKQLDFLADLPRDAYIRETPPPQDCRDVTDYGAAASNSGEENAAAINRAIGEASAAGGGTVYIPQGVYKTATVQLQDNVTLFVAGTLQSMSYDENKASDSKLNQGVICARGVKNIELCGGGTIDGSGESFCKEPERIDALQPLDPFRLKEYVVEFRKRIRFEKKDSGRVELIHIEDCDDVEIHDIELTRSALWTCHLQTSRDVSIHHMVIHNNYHVANTDGIDVDSCQRVAVEDCFIVTGDDGLCIKTDAGQPVSDVSFRRCAVMSLANCFKIGTMVTQDVEHVTVEDCRFFLTGTAGGYAGISIESDCGKTVRDITVRNIEMENVTAPLLLWLGARDGRTPGRLDSVTIENVTAKNADLPSAITGTVWEDQDYRVTNVRISNVDVTYRDCEEKLNIRKKGVGYEAMEGYPEITRVSHVYFLSHSLSGYWDLPVYGLFVRHADGLTLENFHVMPRASNTRPADNVTNEADRIDVSGVTITD